MTTPAKRTFGARLRVLALVVALLAAIVVPVGTAADRAEAASAADWDAGYIIDDSVFYNSNAMAASDVQAFLDSKVASCASGYTCLKSYGQATGNIAGDRYCDGYKASSYQTAAQIIDAVARSCGISQQALLVLLEKEQGLITARAPSSWAYTAAMGQACPDTAPCDPSYSGFFYQVYYGARQFEVYRLNPDSFGYRAGRTNNILYNPDASCGTKSVYITNQATAALYIYTPYTPNAAALSNLYGSGDGCSSYGNRNFWRLFTDWFGNPRSYAVLDGFSAFYNARGGASGPIGTPVSHAVFVEQNGQGWFQRFSGGNLYGSYTGGTVFIAKNVILAEYDRQAGPYGSMGWPNGEQVCAAGANCSQSFVNAIISTSATYGAHVLWGGIRDYWVQSGGSTGSLGSALNDMVYSQPSAGTAWVQNFQSGILVQSAAGFQLVRYGSIQAEWSRSGQGSGPLGWPTGAQACADAGCAQRFTGGVVTDSFAYGAFPVTGAFAAEWDARGGLAGLGPAFNRVVDSNGRTIQNFGAGILTGSATATLLVPYGPIQATWSAAGAQNGTYGWPEAAVQCDGTMCAQQFQGAILSNSAWGVYTTFGALAGAWKASGGVGGYGVAVSAIRYGAANGGGWNQHYARGILTQQSAGQPVFSTYGPILDKWYYYGAESTWLGWPVSPAQCDANGCTQQFQNGVARSDAGGVSFSRS